MNIQFLDFDPEVALRHLETLGGTSFPVLEQRTRLLLLRAAYDQNYTKRPEESSAGVRQDIWGCDDVVGSAIPGFRDAWQQFLMEKFAGREIFSPQLDFNEIFLQRYEPKSFGITPHTDRKIYQNLVCTFSLSGNCRFCLCDDREGSNPIHLDTTPGNVILLRAPGFMGADVRPFHFVEKIEGPRHTIGLRQKI